MSQADRVPLNNIEPLGQERVEKSRWSDDDVRRVQKRTFGVVIISQILGGAGLAAGVSVGALLARDMLGAENVSGVPAALFTLGSASAAFLIGRLTQRWGRRMGLGLGFTAGGLGALGVVVAAASANVALLFGALFVYGAGTATNLQARYAGTDLAEPARRGTAISVALTATTVGAVAGPNLIAPMGKVALSIGIPVLAGPFLLAAVTYTAAGLVLIAMLRPDPYFVARDLSEAPARAVERPSTTADLHPKTGAYVGAMVMVVSQMAMTAVMTMTPIHMQSHHHDLSAVGMVIGFHIAAMYLPSLVTGVLVDKVGRSAMAAVSGVTLLAAGLVAALAPGSSLPWMITALILLGMGWNFGLIAGTAFVVDATDPTNRPRIQGTIDVAIAVAGAAGAALSGVMMASSGYAALSLTAGLVSLILVPTLLWHRRVG
ncbi:MFS transporter [Mycobacterium sp. 155]|uniref:MFS transporter n=1 Tax=Mycobacterium sp. 155 TaxID=1157943 RepID=UPI0003698096|nr:MFS transporter [Mycobacterium sp. 155]